MAAALDLKQLRLHRMQLLATGLLVAMLLLLWLSTVHIAAHPWLHWVRALAEAGAIGAAADWYAVVALFRRPLGLPIPHTAIIPRNKDRIGESLGAFVEQNFLTPENVLRRLEHHNVAEAIASWLVEARNNRAMAQAVSDLIPGVLRAGSDEDLRRLLDRTLTPMLLRLDVAGLAAHLLALLRRGDRHQALLNQVLETMEGWLSANQGLIKAKFSEASRYTPAVFDEYIVSKFVDGIVVLLREVAGDPQHELRARFDVATNQLIHDLKTSPAYRRYGRALMRDVVVHVRNEDYYRVLWGDIRARVESDLRAERSVLREHVAGALDLLGKEILADPAVQQKLNAWWLDIVRALVLRFRHEVSALITEVVKSWDADEVSRKLELEIGRDLQFIRINGTVVGGAVGVLLHAAALAIG
jgi:uncharacterized membrane-anchored protein YjiN (DUF445 family)